MPEASETLSSGGAAASRSAKAHDLLALMGAFAREHGIALTADDVVQRFLDDASLKLGAALQDQKLIHGTRTERQFEALVLTLGKFRLLKAEDQGRLHAGVRCRAPDYRIVLEDGGQWLVEVKNVRGEDDDPESQIAELTAPYLASLEAYCELVGAPLRIAHYWSRWKMWTVVDPAKFRKPSGGARFEMIEAITANELVRLGDVHFYTEPPIRMLVETDPTPLTAGVGETEEIATRTSGVRLFAAGKELTRPQSQHLAWVLMLYGEWTTDGPRAVTADGKLVGIEFVVEPVEADDATDDEPVMMGRAIGQASRIFARYFAEVTTAEDAVIQLQGQAKPEWFAPISNWDFKTEQLALWIFHIQPQGISKASQVVDCV
jgi:hypothetical protein